MKKALRIIATIFLSFLVLILVNYLYIKCNTIDVDIVDYEIKQLEDSDMIELFCDDSKDYTKLFEKSPEDFYLISCIFNVKNTHSISYVNWKVAAKELTNKYRIFYNQYKGEGEFYQIEKNSTIENLGTGLLIYTNGESIENIEKEFLSNVHFYAVGCPSN